MDNFAKNLKMLRRQKGMNQEELAEKLNIRKTTVSNYETGYSRPRMSMMHQIATLFGTSVNMLVQDPSTVLKSPDFAEEAGSTSVPLYAHVNGPNFWGEPLEGLTFPTAFLGAGEFFALKITGDHMDKASLSTGSIAIVRKQGLFDNGDVVLVSLDAEPAFVSRYYAVGQLISLVPDSSNPACRPLIIDPKEQSVNLFGKVVNSLQKIV